MAGVVLKKKFLPKKEVEVSRSVIFSTFVEEHKMEVIFFSFSRSTQSQLDRDTSHVSTNCYYEMRD